MMTALLKNAAAAAALVVCASAASAAVIHTDGFTDGGNTTDYRSVGSFSTMLVSPIARVASISFELFGARSVDGQNDYEDVYSFALNGITLFRGTFDLGGGGANVVYDNPNGFAFAPLSFGFFQGGKVTVSGLINLDAGSNEFAFSFTSPGSANGGGQDKGDESWGVNDVDVSPVPLPAAMPLLAGAIAGLGALGLRRRKSKQV
jgi:hypothetical protein